MRVAIVRQGFWRAVTMAAVFGAALAAAAPAAEAHWWVHRSFVRPWHHVTYHRWHPWGPRFYRPWWRPVFFRPFPGPVFHRRVVLVRPPVVPHRVVVIHAPPRVVYRTRVIYRTAAVIHHPVVHHPVHHAPVIHYSGRNCGCQN